jgi:hypothetical protein
MIGGEGLRFVFKCGVKIGGKLLNSKNFGQEKK